MDIKEALKQNKSKASGAQVGCKAENFDPKNEIEHK